MQPYRPGRRMQRRSSTSSLFEEARNASTSSIQLSPISSFDGPQYSTSNALPASPLTLPPLRSVISTDSFASPTYSRRPRSRQASISPSSSFSSFPDPLGTQDALFSDLNSTTFGTPRSSGNGLPTFSPSTLPSFDSLPSLRVSSSTFGSVGGGVLASSSNPDSPGSDVSYRTDDSFGSGLGGFPAVQRIFNEAGHFFQFAQEHFEARPAGNTSETKRSPNYLYCLCGNRKTTGCKWQITAKELRGVGGLNVYKLFTDYQVHDSRCLARAGTATSTRSIDSASTGSRRPRRPATRAVTTQRQPTLAALDASIGPDTSSFNSTFLSPAHTARPYASSSSMSRRPSTLDDLDERTQSALAGMSMLSTNSPNARSIQSLTPLGPPSLSTPWSGGAFSPSQQDWLPPTSSPSAFSMYGSSRNAGTGRRRTLSRMASTPFLSSSTSSASSSGSRRYADWSSATQDFQQY